MNETERNKLSEANAKARGLLRIIVGIIVGITSAKRHDWLVIVNFGGGFIFIEAVLTFIIAYIKIYKQNKKYGINSLESEYSFANKIMWRQVVLSTIFIGVVAILTKLITNIFL